MKLNLKDEPKEWRKTALLTLAGLAVLASLLRWRHHVGNPSWLAILLLLGVTGLAACLQPRWFRGYHCLSMRVGFALSQFLGHILLVLFFVFLITPLGFVLRLLGNDPLQLKQPKDISTYWRDAKDCGPLDRLF